MRTLLFLAAIGLAVGGMLAVIVNLASSIGDAR